MALNLPQPAQDNKRQASFARLNTHICRPAHANISSMQLSLFDLDNTLLAADSDHLWGEYLVQIGAVDAEYYREKNDAFYADYQAGCLDINAFLAFTLKPLTQHSPEQLHTWRANFIAEVIKPQIAAATASLLAEHRAHGRHLAIITATNEFVTQPIAELLGVKTLIATRVGVADGQYTGESPGVPCFQNGKITRLQAWLAEQPETPQETWFYSDSINDLPLLEFVDHPYAVDADAKLSAIAKTKSWPHITLRAGAQPSPIDLG